MSQVDIRKATTSDVERIQACARSAYAMYVERIGREPAPMVADFVTQVQDGHILPMTSSQGGQEPLYYRSMMTVGVYRDNIRGS